VTQTYHQIPGQRADVPRPGVVYAYTTRRVDRRGMPTDGVEEGYTGRTRDITRRHAQHAGLVPQRDGTIAEQPWWDLRVGDVRVVERAVLTDEELDDLERRWIADLQPRYCDKDNPRPDKIRKFEARRHRDARDAARGLVPRQWEPLRVDPVTPAEPGRVWPVVKTILRSPWTWWAVAWAAASVALWQLLAAVTSEVGADVPGRTLVMAAAIAAGLGLWKLRAETRRRWRRWKRRRR
jgi:hypothetical protein